MAMAGKVRIMLSGNFFADDLEWVQGGSELQVDIVNMDTKGSPEDMDAFYDKLYKCDLFVVQWEAYAVQRLFARHSSDKRFMEFMTSPNVKRVFWSMDSHHQWPVEQKLQSFFHTIYTAHSNYIDRLEEGKGVWLPCYWQHGSRKQLWAESNVTVEPSYDIVSAFQAYLGIGDRNIIMAKCMHLLEKSQLSYFLGNVSSERSCNALRSGKVVLNVSIMDDLNLRNIEAIALNKVMLASRVPDHDKLDLDYRNTVFFNRDMSDFLEALDMALTLASTERPSTVENILDHHMLMHRYITMFNRELGLNLRGLPFEKVGLPNTEKQSFIVDLQAGDIVFSPVDLSLKAVWCHLNYDQDQDAFSELQWLCKQESEKLQDHQDFILQLFMRILHREFKESSLGYQVLLLSLSSMVMEKSIQSVMKNEWC